MLSLYLVTPVKHKFLMSLPYLLNASLVLTDLSDTKLIYCFGESHAYISGPLNFLPELTLGFYIVMLGIYSVIFLAGKFYSKSIVVMFMVVSTILSEIGESVGFSEGYSETVIVVEMIIYYFFLTSIEHSRMQKELYESRIALEQDRLKLLVAQIQPHFIFNTLVTIQSLCYTDSEKAADCIDVFGDYLRANIDSLSSDKPIDFSAELEHIRQYVALEKAGIDFDFKLITELESIDFKIPPLTVQPLVENAVKHGAMSRRDGSGIIRIKTEILGEEITITVTDNGLGADLTAKQKEHKSVGIENIRQRLKVQCDGTLKVHTDEGGCTAIITIPQTKTLS